MRHEWTKVVVDGYGADELDFASQLQAAGQPVKDQLDDQIMSPLVNAAAEGASLLIVGHADRVDSAESHAARLEREKAASKSRADSASDAILTFLRAEWLSPGPTAWSDLPYLGVYVAGVGATELVDAGGTEEARRRNRRVWMALCRFISDE